MQKEIHLSDRFIASPSDIHALIQHVKAAVFPTKFTVKDFKLNNDDLKTALQEAMPKVASHVDLRTGPSSSPDLIEILQKCNRVTSFHVRCHRTDDIAGIGKMIKAISGNLTELKMEIEFSIFREWTHEFPKLTKLTVIYIPSAGSTEENLHAFGSYITNALGTKCLTEMTVRVNDLLDGRTDYFARNMTRILRQTPNLETLSISSGVNGGDAPPRSNTTSDNMEANFALADTIRSLNALQTLCMTQCNPSEFVEFVSRSLGPSLEQLDLSNSNSRSAKQREEFGDIVGRFGPKLKTAKFGIVVGLPGTDPKAFAPFLNTDANVEYRVYDLRLRQNLHGYKILVQCRIDYLRILSMLSKSQKIKGKTVFSSDLDRLLVSFIESGALENGEEEEEEEFRA